MIMRCSVAFGVASPMLRAPTPAILSAMTIESPCNKICTLDPLTGTCIGCGRTLAEIGGWLSFGVAERRRIIAELPSRLAARRVAAHVAQ